jgi:hypothetical protein
MPCQHFAKVIGRKETFIPQSDVATHGERIVFPTPPPGVMVRFLARNPKNPLEELWALCVDREMFPEANLGEFFSQSGVQQLSYQEMVSLGKSFDPNFVPPPVIV